MIKLSDDEIAAYHVEIRCQIAKTYLTEYRNLQSNLLPTIKPEFFASQPAKTTCSISDTCIVKKDNQFSLTSIPRNLLFFGAVVTTVIVGATITNRFKLV